jgi:hypothetical protein
MSATQPAVQQWPVVELKFTGEDYESPPASPKPFPLEAANKAWIEGRKLYLEQHPEENNYKLTDWSKILGPQLEK